MQAITRTTVSIVFHLIITLIGLSVIWTHGGVAYKCPLLRRRKRQMVYGASSTLDNAHQTCETLSTHERIFIGTCCDIETQFSNSEEVQRNRFYYNAVQQRCRDKQEDECSDFYMGILVNQANRNGLTVLFHELKYKQLIRKGQSSEYRLF